MRLPGGKPPLGVGARRRWFPQQRYGTDMAAGVVGCSRRLAGCFPIGSSAARRQHQFECHVLYPQHVKPHTTITSKPPASNKFQQHAENHFKYWFLEKIPRYCGRHIRTKHMTLKEAPYTIRSSVGRRASDCFFCRRASTAKGH